MTSGTSLPPHLERFVREQIATGRYDTEADVIRAALRMLVASNVVTPPSNPRAETPSDSRGKPKLPVQTEKWVTPGEWVAGLSTAGTTPAPVRRSPRGLLADLRSGISSDDIRKARGEMWSGLRHGEA